MSRLGIAVLGGAVVAALALAYFVPGDRRATPPAASEQAIALPPRAQPTPSSPSAAQAATPVAPTPLAPSPPAVTPPASAASGFPASGGATSAPDASAPAASAPAASAPAVAAPAVAALPPAAVPAAPRPAAILPSFDVLRVTPRGDAVIAGRAAPGSEVTVLDGDTVIGKVTADSRGEWVLLPSQPLAPGNRRLTLLAQPPGGGVAMRSAGEVLLAVPEANRDVAGQPAQAAAPLAILVPRDGEGAARALQVPGAEGAVRPTVPVAAGNRMLSLDIVEYGAEGRLSLSGRAEPGANLMLYLDDKPVGSAVAAPDGRWSTSPPDLVPPGRYSLRVDDVRAGDGKVLARLSLPFQRSAPPRDPGAGQFIVVQPGDNLWQIARQTYGAGPRFSLIFAANRAQIADPDLIYPGQIFQLPTAN